MDNFNEAFKREYERACKEMAVEVERYQKIISGKIKVDTLDEIAEAHYFIAGDYLAKKMNKEALFHAKKSFEIYEKTGAFHSDVEKRKFSEWIKSMEK